MVVDTNVVVADYGGLTLDDELAFVRSATAGCGDERSFCFLAGHHPPAAVHGHGRGRAPGYAARMARLVAAAQGRAVAFFAGHVHALEHLALGPLDVFISGSTAMGGLMRLRWKVPASAQARFATTAWGFAILEADRAGWRVRFQDFEGAPLHCCEGGPRGAVPAGRVPASRGRAALTPPQGSAGEPGAPEVSGSRLSSSAPRRASPYAAASAPSWAARMRSTSTSRTKPFCRFPMPTM